MLADSSRRNGSGHPSLKTQARLLANVATFFAAAVSWSWLLQIPEQNEPNLIYLVALALFCIAVGSSCAVALLLFMIFLIHLFRRIRA